MLRSFPGPYGANKIPDRNRTDGIMAGKRAFPEGVRGGLRQNADLSGPDAGGRHGRAAREDVPPGARHPPGAVDETGGPSHDAPVRGRAAVSLLSGLEGRCRHRGGGPGPARKGSCRTVGPRFVGCEAKAPGAGIPPGRSLLERSRSHGTDVVGAAIGTVARAQALAPSDPGPKDFPDPERGHGDRSGRRRDSARVPD